MKGRNGRLIIPDNTELAGARATVKQLRNGPITGGRLSHIIRYLDSNRESGLTDLEVTRAEVVDWWHVCQGDGETAIPFQQLGEVDQEHVWNNLLLSVTETFG